MRFEPCVGADDVCEVLRVDPGRPTTFENVFVGAHAARDSTTPRILIAQNDSATHTITVELIDRNAVISAAWRQSSRDCSFAFAATTATEVGFELRSPNWESRFYRADFDTLPAMPTEPIAMLTAAEQEGVGAQAMALSDSTMAIVLQPGGVYWMFQDGQQRRRGGPLEPDVPGIVSNSFALVGERLYWGYPGGLATTARFDAPGVHLRTPPEGFEVVYVDADDDDLVWVEYDRTRAQLWKSPLATAPEEVVPTYVTTFPVLSDPALGDGLVAFVQSEPKRILVVDLDVGTVRGWSLPAGMDGMRILYVNRDEIGFATQRNPPSIRFYTFARVQLSAFEPIE